MVRHWPNPARTRAATTTRQPPGIGTLIVLGTSPVFGHHVLSGTVPALIGRDHIAGICLIALHELLAPVHLGFQIVLTLGLSSAIFDRVRAGVAARRTLRALVSRVALESSIISRAAVRSMKRFDRWAVS